MFYLYGIVILSLYWDVVTVIVTFDVVTTLYFVKVVKYHLREYGEGPEKRGVGLYCWELKVVIVNQNG